MKEVLDLLGSSAVLEGSIVKLYSRAELYDGPEKIQAK
jgi:hypothetical protein